MYEDRNQINTPMFQPYVEQEVVKAIPLMELLNKHQVSHLDVLVIDTEGHDYHILKQLDFTRYLPKIIFAEYVNLPAHEQLEMKKLLTQHGYIYTPQFDILAVRPELLNA